MAPSSWICVEFRANVSELRSVRTLMFVPPQWTGRPFVRPPRRFRHLLRSHLRDHLSTAGFLPYDVLFNLKSFAVVVLQFIHIKEQTVSCNLCLFQFAHVSYIVANSSMLVSKFCPCGYIMYSHFVLAFHIPISCFTIRNGHSICRYESVSRSIRAVFYTLK